MAPRLVYVHVLFKPGLRYSHPLRLSTNPMKSVPFTRITAYACLVGGVLFTLSLVLMFAVETMPPDAKAFFKEHDYVLRTTFFLSQAGFMAGLLGVLRTGAAGRRGAGKALLLVPLLGQVCYAVSAWLPTRTVMTLLPVPLTQLGALLNAAGMVAVGIAVLRARAWRGSTRWIPLAVGLYPFLVMFPILIVSGRPPGYVIGLWGVVWAVLGAGIARNATERRAVTA